MTLVINDRNSFFGSENYPAKTVKVFTELIRSSVGSF